MNRRKAEKVLKSKKLTTEEKILRAIKRLGKTPEEIKDRLVALGFEGFDQTAENACPVCVYLISIGFKKPSVSTYSVRANGKYVNFPDAMKDFQRKCAYGQVSGLGGFKPCG